MPKRPPFTPGAEDRRLLSDHLLYEVQGLYFTAYVLTTTRGLLDQSAVNVFLDDFTIHVRQLIDFFWRDRNPGSGTDAFAADYFPPGEWRMLCPTDQQPEPLSEAVRKKIGWGVVHLTYGRGWANPAEKGWDVAGIARALALAPTVIRFVEEVDAAQFDPQYFALVRPAVEPWLSPL